MPKILIIEDDQNIRESIVEILELKGYQTFSATNGEEGFFAAIKEKPHLIVCDIMMPEMDGYELLSLIRETEIISNCPFIFLTAMAQREDIRKGINLGADDFITKPFEVSELLNSIESKLQKKSRLAREIILSEQKRFSQDLHDGVQHILLNLKLTLEDLGVGLKDIPTEEKEKYLNALYLTEEAIAETYAVVQSTKPAILNEIGLQNALLHLFENINHLKNLTITFDYKLDLSLTDAIEIIIYRLVQECLNNIIKHSEAKEAQITITQIKSTIYLKIRDNGKGFNTQEIDKKKKGLTGMNERVNQFNGSFCIKSQEGKGTEISIQIPI